MNWLALGLIGSLVVTAQQPPASTLGDNAALRYWSAFAQMQDSTITPEQARELQAVLDGSARYSESKYRDLVDRNRLAVETLQRGAAIPQCDWGLEYERGSATPIDYVRKALALGRLNVLYALHQLDTGDRHGAIRTLARGMRFSHDVAVGGPLIAALAAKKLYLAHLRAINLAEQMKALTPDEKALLSGELSKHEPDGVDWQSTVRHEFEVLSRSGSPVPAAVTELYRRTLEDARQLPNLQQAIARTPQPIAALIPNPQNILAQKRELDERLQTFRLMLRE